MTATIEKQSNAPTIAIRSEIYVENGRVKEIAHISPNDSIAHIYVRNPHEYLFMATERTIRTHVEKLNARELPSTVRRTFNMSVDQLLLENEYTFTDVPFSTYSQSKE